MGSADFDFDDGERNIISRDWGGQEKGNNLISRFELMPPTYERNLDAAGGEPSCAICGKGVTNPVGWVNIHGGGRCIVGKEEAHGLSDAEDMGWFPVGRECAKKVVGYVEEEPGE